MAHDEHSAEHHGHHIIPFKTLATVFGTLVALTVLTVLTARFVDLGPLNVPLALAIAGTKSALVVMFFMALKYDNPVNTLAFAVGSVFVLVFLTFTLFDTLFRGDLGNVGVETIMDTERYEEVLREREPDPADLRVTPAEVEASAADAAGSDAPVATEEAAAEEAADGEVVEEEAEVETP